MKGVLSKAGKYKREKVVFNIEMIRFALFISLLPTTDVPTKGCPCQDREDLQKSLSPPAVLVLQRRFSF